MDDVVTNDDFRAVAGWLYAWFWAEVAGVVFGATAVLALVLWAADAAGPIAAILAAAFWLQWGATALVRWRAARALSRNPLGRRYSPWRMDDLARMTGMAVALWFASVPAIAFCLSIDYLDIGDGIFASVTLPVVAIGFALCTMLLARTRRALVNGFADWVGIWSRAHALARPYPGAVGLQRWADELVVLGAAALAFFVYEYGVIALFLTVSTVWWMLVRIRRALLLRNLAQVLDRADVAQAGLNSESALPG